MARSASLAAVPAIVSIDVLVSPTQQPHAVPPPTTLVTAGCPAGWMEVIDGNVAKTDEGLQGAVLVS